MSHFAESRGSTAICTADRTSITVRGEDLCNDILGKTTLSTFIYLHLTGRRPTEPQALMLDALIISIAEHGLAPSVIAARMTYASGPEALQAAVAAGVLGAGSVVLGAADEAATLLQAGVDRIARGENDRTVASSLAEAAATSNTKLPGFGHPLHKPNDPRSDKLIELALSYGVAGSHVSFLAVLSEEADRVWGKHLVVNVQAAMAAIALDMDMPAFLARAIPIIGRTIGVLGHIAEEHQNPIAFHAAMLIGEAIEYDPA